jgi:hypothetical protein
VSQLKGTAGHVPQVERGENGEDVVVIHCSRICHDRLVGMKEQGLGRVERRRGSVGRCLIVLPLSGLAVKKILASECAEKETEALEHILEQDERSIEQRKILLDWIEPCRQVMDSRHPTPPRAENHNGRRHMPVTNCI